MGLFDKIKNIFTAEKKEEKQVEAYDKGLLKTRVEFTSKLGKLSSKYKSVTDEYFD